MTAAMKLDTVPAPSRLAAVDEAMSAEHDDQAKLEQLYEAHGHAVTQRLYRLCGDPEVAQDLCQDAFVVALGKLGAQGEVHSVTAWLHGIAYNLLRDHRKATLRKRGLWQRWFGREREPAPALMAASGEGDEQQLLRQLDAALRGLSLDKRDAFILRQVEGLSLAEAAEVLDVSVQTVSYRTKHAEEHVRAAFEAS